MANCDGDLGEFFGARFGHFNKLSKKGEVAMTTRKLGAMIFLLFAMPAAWAGNVLGDPSKFSSCTVSAELKLNGAWCSGATCPALLVGALAEAHQNYDMSAYADCAMPDGQSERLYLDKTFRIKQDSNCASGVEYDGGADADGPNQFYGYDRQAYFHRYDGSNNVYYPLGTATLQVVREGTATTAPVPILRFSRGLLGNLTVSSWHGTTGTYAGCTSAYDVLNMHGTLENTPMVEVEDAEAQVSELADGAEEESQKAIFDVLSSAGVLPPVPVPDIVAGLALPVPIYVVKVDYRTASGSVAQASANGIVGLPTVIPVPNRNSSRLETLTVTVGADTAAKSYKVSIDHGATSCLNAKVTVSFSQAGTSNSLDLGYDAYPYFTGDESTIAAPTHFTMTYGAGSVDKFSIASSSYCDKNFKVWGNGADANAQVHGGFEATMFGDDHVDVQQVKDTTGANRFSLRAGIVGYFKVRLDTSAKNTTYTLVNPAPAIDLCVASNNACNASYRQGVRADSSASFLSEPTPTRATISINDNNGQTYADVTVGSLNYDYYFDIRPSAAYPFTGHGFDGNFFLDTHGTYLVGRYGGKGITVNSPSPGFIAQSRHLVLRKEKDCDWTGVVCVYYPVIDRYGSMTCPGGFDISKDNFPNWIEDWVQNLICSN